MHWYKFWLIIGLFLTGIIILSLSACKSGGKEAGKTLKYFDIKGYFEKDSARLAKQNNLVLKSVSHNGFTQRKKVHIANWGIEFALFKQSDINKPAWKNSYQVINGKDMFIYKAKDTDLTTREIIIRMVKNKVTSIVILNHTANLLYQTTEKLSYFPDSLYLIEKYQKVKLMGSNKYRIEGVIIR